jgi:hypothetical protein
VRLSNGCLGVVTRCQRGLSHRPTVEVRFDPQGNCLENPMEIDLTEDLNATIMEVLHELPAGWVCLAGDGQPA